MAADRGRFRFELQSIGAAPLPAGQGEVIEIRLRAGGRPVGVPQGWEDTVAGGAGAVAAPIGRDEPVIIASDVPIDGPGGVGEGSGPSAMGGRARSGGAIVLIRSRKRNAFRLLIWSFRKGARRIMLPT